MPPSLVHPRLLVAGDVPAAFLLNLRKCAAPIFMILYVQVTQVFKGDRICFSTLVEG